MLYMKTRELLQCDIKTFGLKIERLKQKDLYRHMERIAGSLGEPDLEALLRSAVDGLFAGGTVPETSQEEMDRVFDAIGKHIVPTEENVETVMRLLALLVTFLRQRVKEAARERRLEGRAKGHTEHNRAGRCDDPECPKHGHSPKAEKVPAAGDRNLALSIRSAIA
jgi:hypothetical protein